MALSKSDIPRSVTPTVTCIFAFGTSGSWYIKPNDFFLFFLPHCSFILLTLKHWIAHWCSLSRGNRIKHGANVSCLHSLGPCPLKLVPRTAAYSIRLRWAE